MASAGSHRSAWAHGRLAGNFEGGFAYLALLILLTILGIVSATSLQLGVVSHRRAAEQALLDIGAAYGDALESYRKATPVGQPDAPTTLQDLLRDPRFAAPVRHLRQLHADPITGATQWGIVTGRGQPGIIGIHSLSQQKPIKIGNFAGRFQSFEGKRRYADWVFLRRQQGIDPAAVGPANAPAPSAADAAPALPGMPLFGPLVTPMPPSTVAPPAVAPAVPVPAMTPAPTVMPTTEPPETPASAPADRGDTSSPPAET